MIQINLLDQSAGKSKAATAGPAGAITPRPSGGGMGGPVIAIVAALMLSINGLLFWSDWKEVSESNHAVDAIRTEQSKLKTEVTRKLTAAEQIRKFREVVDNQMDVLKSLDPTNRILWCEKINELSSLMPPSVFLAEVKVDEDVKMVQTEASRIAHEKWEKATNKDKLKEPAIVQKPIISYIVHLTGLALGKDNVEQAQNVTAFQKALVEHKQVMPDGSTHHFMDGFNPNIDFEAVNSTTYEGTAVNKFVFRLVTKPMGEDEKTSKKSTKQIADNQADGVAVRTVASNN